MAGLFACFAAASIAAEVYGDPGDPVAGRVLGTTIHGKNSEELRDVILGRLLEVFAMEKNIQVTAEEIAGYQKAREDSMRADRAERAAASAALKRQLAAKGLEKAKRAALEKEIQMIDELLASTAPGTSAQNAEEKAAREQIAAAFIRHWKINRALHEQYGGRIGYQQGGPEPLDATRQFLLERKERGDFTIATKELDQAFWSYFLDDSKHDFYKPGSEDEARAFDSPPWAANPGASRN